jgi:hypothetical protein
LIALWIVSTAHAGAWTRGAGSVYAKGSLDAYGSSQYVDPRGIAVDASYHGEQIGTYVEVGVLDNLQLTAQVPVQSGTNTFPVGTEEGHATSVRMGDLWLALQTGLLEKPFRLAVSIDGKIPLYSNDSIGEGGGAYRAYFPLPGDGQIDLGAWLWGGGSIPGTQLWGQLGAGYRYRSSWFVGFVTDADFSDGIPMRGQLGFGTKGSWISLDVDAFQALVQDDITREWVTAGPSGGWALGRGFTLEGRVSVDLYTRHSSQGVGGGVGVSWKR